MKRCKLFFCDNEHFAKGYCKKHYQCLRRHGSPISPYQEDVLKMMNMLTLARQIVGDKILTEEDESMRSLMKTFLNSSSGEGESSLPPCGKCGKRPTILTDGITYILKSCECKNEPILLKELLSE